MGTRVLPIVEPRYSTIIGRPIDNTALAQANCWWRYLASMVLHRRREGAPPPGIAMGSNWHHALEAHYKYVPWEFMDELPLIQGNEGRATIVRNAIKDQLYNTVDNAVMERWEDHQQPDDHRTYRRLMMDYEAFLRKYGLPWEGEDKTLGWPDSPMVEMCGEVAIPGARHPYAYKIDRVFRSVGNYYIEDHKTSSRAFDFGQYSLDNQMMGYAACAWLLTGQLIAGVRINAIIIHKNDTVFERRTIPFNEDRLLAWMRNLDYRFADIEERMMTMEAIVSSFSKDGKEPTCEDLEEAFPRNHTICSGKYGMCTYAGVCSLVPELRQRALEDDFAVIPWNPLESQGEATVDA